MEAIRARRDVTTYLCGRLRQKVLARACEREVGNRIIQGFPK